MIRPDLKNIVSNYITVQSRFKRAIDRYDGLIIIAMICYSAILSYLSIFRYHSFQLEEDLALFHQALWNTLSEGGLLVNSLEGGSHFGVHFSPILFSLLPFYALAPSPQTLLIAQSVLLSLGAIPIYLLAREKLGERAGVIFGFLYLLYPGLHGVNLYDFHEVAFLPFLVGMTLWGYLTGRKNMLLLFGLLSLLIKEDVALIILMIGLLGLNQTRKEEGTERFPYAVLTFCAVGVLIAFHLVIRLAFLPHGDAPVDGFLTQYFDPLMNISQNNGDRLSYLLMMFLPLVFLSLGSPEICIIGIPSGLEILLSPNPLFFSIYYQYSALIIPVIFVSAICTLRKIQCSQNPQISRFYGVFLCLILISSILCSIGYSPASQQVSVIQTSDMQIMEKHNQYLDFIISIIPADTSISTQYNLLPVLSKFKEIGYGYNPDSDIILIDYALPKRAADFAEEIENIRNHFTLLSKKNGLYVYVNTNNKPLLEILSQRLSEKYQV